MAKLTEAVQEVEELYKATYTGRINFYFWLDKKYVAFIREMDLAKTDQIAGIYKNILDRQLYNIGADELEDIVV